MKAAPRSHPRAGPPDDGDESFDMK